MDRSKSDETRHRTLLETNAVAGKLLRLQCWSAVHRLEKDCRRILQIVADWQTDGAWQSLTATWAEFCTAYLKLPEDVVFHLCEAARRLDNDGQRD
jgi:hypothetical protein